MTITNNQQLWVHGVGIINVVFGQWTMEETQNGRSFISPIIQKEYVLQHCFQ
jgi:hypothetical protein